MIRQVRAERGWAWFKEAWKLFRGAPATWTGMSLVLLLILLAGELASTIGDAVSSVLEPILIAGILIACRAQATGGRPRVDHLFEGFKGGRVLTLGGLGLLDFALTEGFSRLGRELLLDGSEWSELLKASFWREFFATATPFSIVKFSAVGALGTTLYLSLIAAFWFVPALVALDSWKPLPALKESFVGTLKNLPAMTVFFLASVGFAILASVPLYLGLLVFFPVFLIASYSAYRDVFIQESEGPEYLTK